MHNYSLSTVTKKAFSLGRKKRKKRKNPDSFPYREESAKGFTLVPDMCPTSLRVYDYTWADWELLLQGFLTYL